MWWGKRGRKHFTRLFLVEVLPLWALLPASLPSPVCLEWQGPSQGRRGVCRCSERPAAGVSGRSEPQVVGGPHCVLTFSSWNLFSKQQTPGDGPALTPDLLQCDPGPSAVVGLPSETACSPGRRSLPRLQWPARLHWGPHAGNHSPSFSL